MIVGPLQLSAWSLESWRLVLPQFHSFGQPHNGARVGKVCIYSVTLWGVSVRVRAKDLKTLVPVDSKDWKSESDERNRDGR